MEKFIFVSSLLLLVFELSKALCKYYLLQFYPCPGDRIVKELHMYLWEFTSLVVGIVCRVVTHQARPPGVSL